MSAFLVVPELPCRFSTRQVRRLSAYIAAADAVGLIGVDTVAAAGSAVDDVASSANGVDDVVAVAASDDVGVKASGEPVCAGPAGEPVAAAAALQHVITRPAVQAVRAAASEDSRASRAVADLRGRLDAPTTGLEKIPSLWVFGMPMLLQQCPGHTPPTPCARPRNR